ncbi:MAG: histidine kinase dimerization/phospho-acceptor domain-containing protein [Gemmataceae bacterium]
MFRRLLLPYALASLAVSGGVAVVAALFPLSLAAALGLFAVFHLLAVAAVSAGLARGLARRLAALVRGVNDVAAGVADVRVFPTGKDEISALGDRFNAMSERLSSRITRLEGDHQQLRTILSSMVEGVVAVDPAHRVLFINERGRELLQLSGSTAVGRRLWEVSRHRPLLDAVQTALAGRSCQTEVGWTGTTPRSLMVHAAGLPGDPPRGAVLVLHDISELRRLERLRQDFVANVSHELKTPLAVIKVCVETLLDGAVDDAVHRGRFLEQIAGQADRLHALILDLLSLARIESGEELFDLAAVPLDAVARDCGERHLPRAEARRQSLTVDGGR